MPLKDPEARRAYAAEWRSRQSSRESVALSNRRAALKRKYGITLEEYDALVEAQGDVCGICGRGEPGGGENRRGFWHVDHDHDTGAVRGLLCMSCNTGLGHLGDTEEGLLRALKYVRTHQRAATEVTAR